MKLQRLLARALATALAVPAGAACNGSSSSLPDLPAACDDQRTYSVAYDGGDAPQRSAAGYPQRSPYCVQVCSVAGDVGLAPGCGCQIEFACALDDAGISVSCTSSYICIGGRRVEGASTAPAALLGHLAALERASVVAFSMLRRELRAHRAPSSLLRACSRARRDERRHARSVSALARRAGERVPPVVVVPLATRSLEAIAIENVVEGCVRETFGALVAAWQSLHAADREVAIVMQRIAREEAQHAALAWQVHRWIEPRLDREGRARVAEAHHAALATLAAEAAIETEPRARRALGLPRAAQARAMVDALAAA